MQKEKTTNKWDKQHVYDLDISLLVIFLTQTFFGLGKSKNILSLRIQTLP